jgi:hypothetical protein
VQGAGIGWRKSLDVSEQCQRYFAAIAGGAIAVTWLTAGFVTALVCVAAAVGSYAFSAMTQRRKAPRARSVRQRQPRPRPPQIEIEIESQPSATGTYGW